MNGPANQNVVFAVDLGGTHLRVALVDEEGRIHAQRKESTPKDTDAAGVVRALVKAVRACASEKGINASLIGAASIVVPGTVSKDNRMVLQVPNLPSLDNVALKPILEDQLGLPIVLENDANAAAIGEMWLGAACGLRSVICITLGTGVGGGIILDGELWRGADGSAGEIGHTAVDPFAGPRCKCGNRGCLEVFASATAIVRMAREELANRQDSVLLSEGLTAERVFNAGREGDELSLDVFKRMGTYLGVGIANLINLLNPEIIVIGGGVVDGWKLFERHMRQEVAARAFPLTAERVRIMPSVCGDNAGLLGAARLAFDDRARQNLRSQQKVTRKEIQAP
jgi:glucokinase